MSSNVPSTTRFVEADTGGMYTPPTDRPIDRIRKITAGHLQPVDHNGFPRPKAAPSDAIEFVTPAGPPPTMADALSAAAGAVGADLAQLLDSNAFVTAITPVSPSDQAELQAVIRDFMPVPSAPTMKVNPAQGAPGASAPGPATGTLLERMQRQTAKALDQPLPPGSTTL